ncbi:MAG: DUF1826 domain-containing protein [Flavobacteriales bacterium]|jgi:hypothetical protein|nr:DUF1826 domain-containing protein [Flavobacteriales bacterium]
MITVTHVASNHVSAPDPEALDRIHGPEVNIAVWERSEPVPLQEIEAVLHGLPREIRTHGCVTAIMQHLRDVFAASDIAAEHLLHDIALLLEGFATTSMVKDLRLSLSIVNTNMCRRFHTDVNDLRLLCTYTGPGTLWLPNNAVNDQAIRSHDPHLPIERSPEDVQQVGTGHVAILKGALYPGDRVAACVHRSPTIEETGQRRLLLRIDTNGTLMDL